MTEEIVTYVVKYLATGQISLLRKDIAEGLLKQFKGEYELLEIYEGIGDKFHRSYPKERSSCEELVKGEEKMTTGEKFYCLIQDIKDYIQHNNLEQNEELDFILRQSEELQSDYGRLERENERMSTILEGCGLGDNNGYSFCGVDKAYKESKQENKELKSKNELFMNGDYCANGCKKMNNAFCDAHTAIINENNKLRSALEEIREILIVCQEFRTCARCKFYKECDKDLEGCITDKINEVLNIG